MAYKLIDDSDIKAWNTEYDQLTTELGQADLDFGNPGEANKEFDDIIKVSAADVQRVARKYFAPERRNVFYMLPESMRAGAPGAGKEARP